MTSRWSSVRALVVGAALLAACSNDEEPNAATTTTAEQATTSTTTTAPDRPPSTTTTAFDPASVEGQVEAAYLKSWDVYADAVYHLRLDEQALSSVYAERSLDSKRTEINDRISDGRAALVNVEHNYEITVVDDGRTAHVIDQFVNHQVLIDPETKRPVEADPNEVLLFNFQLKQSDGEWRVTLIEKVNL